MSGGYYDPTTPGHHELNEEEVYKVMTCTLSALMGSWGMYVGCDELRQIARRVAYRVERRDLVGKGWVDDDEPRSTFAELKLVCEATLVACCQAWELRVGREAVAEELRRAVDDDQRWFALHRQVAMGVSYLIEGDRQEAAAAKKGEMH